MPKHIYLSLVVVVLVAILGTLYFADRLPAREELPFVEEPKPIPEFPIDEMPTEPQKHPMITVTAPARNVPVASPIFLAGEARGNWFFEASAPVEVYDAGGNLIAQHYITAQGEWMTTNFVPFTGEVSYDSTKAVPGMGKIIFKKDNPSGLPENDDSFEVPVLIQ